MNQILDQVRRARRRLSTELFFNRLVRCWFVALALAVVAISVPKLMVIESLPAGWSLNCGLVGLGAGLLAAIGWTLLRGRSTLEAAAEIDRRYGLRERIASSLSMSPVDAATPAGRALIADAQRALGRVDLGERFRIRLGRGAWLPLAPALIAFLLATFVDNPVAQSGIDPASSSMTKAQLDNATKALRERIAKLRKQLPDKGLEDVEGMFRNLEKQAEQMAKAKDADRKRSLVKINDLAKQLEQRREQLGGDRQLRKQLANMKNLNRGPADKLVEAMKQGQWKNALQELSKLKKQIKNGKLDEQSKQQLQKQISQIQEKLAEAAKARQQAIEGLKKQIENENDLARAGELQQKLDQMKKQIAQMDKLNQLAQKMGQFQQSLKQGDAQGAAAALDQMAAQMEQLQQEMAEGEMLDAALDQLQMAKDAIACEECEGQGCPACGGDRLGEKSGNGLGAGRGRGPRPDEKNDTRFRDSRVRQKTGRGSAVVVGEADGPNLRGAVVESIKEQMTAQGSEPADPQVVEQLPKSRREHAEEYFNLLREGP